MDTCANAPALSAAAPRSLLNGCSPWSTPSSLRGAFSFFFSSLLTQNYPYYIRENVVRTRRALLSEVRALLYPAGTALKWDAVFPSRLL